MGRSPSFFVERRLEPSRKRKGVAGAADAAQLLYLFTSVRTSRALLKSCFLMAQKMNISLDRKINKKKSKHKNEYIHERGNEKGKQDRKRDDEVKDVYSIVTILNIIIYALTSARISSLVSGEVPSLFSQPSRAVLSYTWPSGARTGSVKSSRVMGQRRVSGTSSSILKKELFPSID